MFSSQLRSTAARRRGAQFVADAGAWTEVNVQAASFNDVAYGNSTFVAVSSTHIITSPDGVTWTPYANPVGPVIDIEWSIDRFLTAGLFAVSRSTTGLSGSWSTTTIGPGITSNAVAGGLVSATPTHMSVGSYSAGQPPFVSSVVYVSVNGGTTWSPATSPTTTVVDIAYGTGTFVAVGNNYVMSAASGAGSWISRTPGVASKNWVAVNYGNSRYIALATTGETMISTDEGVTWSAGGTMTGTAFKDIVFAGTDFYVTANSKIFRSVDNGANWTETIVATGNWNGIAVGGGKLVAVSNDATNRVIYKAL